MNKTCGLPSVPAFPPEYASMSVPTFGQKHLVIVGASGMVGRYALRHALDSPLSKA
jgi:hypothetical protein